MLEQMSMKVFTVGLFTSNVGKYIYLSRLLQREPSVRLVFVRASRALSLSETRSTEQNAKVKAIKGSFGMDFPIVGTDEEIILHGLDKKDQPGARIRRIAGDGASDKELIRYYGELISRFGPEGCFATLTTYYAAAMRRKIVGSTVIRQVCLLTLPPTKRWLRGRPLSAFHFIPEFDKRYTEMSGIEVDSFERPVLEQLVRFFRKLREPES